MKNSCLRTALGVVFILLGLSFITGALAFTARLSLNNFLAANPQYLLANDNQASNNSLAGILFAAPGDKLKIAYAQTGGQVSSSQSQIVQNPSLDGNSANQIAITPTGSLPNLSTMTGKTAHGLDLTPAVNSSLRTPSQADSFSILPTYTPTLTATPVPTETATAVLEPTVVLEPTATPEPSPPPPTATSAPVIPTAIVQNRPIGPDPIVNIKIPAINVKRAVIDIGLVQGGGGQPQWNTDILFNTNNRPDLVGHLEGSAYPGEASNIVLVGHNYTYTGSGIFVNLDNLQAGDIIRLTTESGREYAYQVIKVKSIPFSLSGNGLDRHQRFLAPTPGETLTLVTCGGVNIGVFNRRVYVVAVPVQ